jgi:hypothetical protein
MVRRYPRAEACLGRIARRVGIVAPRVHADLLDDFILIVYKTGEGKAVLCNPEKTIRPELGTEFSRVPLRMANHSAGVLGASSTRSVAHRWAAQG